MEENLQMDNSDNKDVVELGFYIDNPKKKFLLPTGLYFECLTKAVGEISNSE